MASASVTGARHFSLLLTCGFGVFLGAAWGRVHPGVPSSRECLRRPGNDSPAFAQQLEVEPAQAALLPGTLDAPLTRAGARKWWWVDR